MGHHHNDRDHRNQQLPAVVQQINPSNYGLPVAPVTDVALVQDALATALSRGCNLLAPLTQLQSLPPDHEIALVVVAFPVDGQWRNKSNGTWYEVDGGKVALHRGALDKLASAAGLSSVPAHCNVELVEKNYWRAKYTVRGKGFDGVERQITKSVEFDVRDGSAEQSKAGRGLRTVRAFGARHAESKAANRAIRSFLGLNGSYTKDEAARPFVFPKLRWVPDMSDPMIKRMVAAKQLGVIDQLFGAQESTIEAPAYVDPNRVIVDEGSPAPSRHQVGTKSAPSQNQHSERSRDRVSAHPDDAPNWSRDEIPQQRAAPQRVQQQRRGTPDCETCGKPLSDKVANFSVDKYGAPLCYDHQPGNQGSGR